MSATNFYEKIESVGSEVSLLISGPPEFLNNLRQLEEAAKEISLFADDYNFKNYRFNGYWTFARKILKYFKQIVKKYNTRNHHELFVMSNLMIVMWNILQEIRRNTVENGIRCLQSMSLFTSINFFQIYLSLDTELQSSVFRENGFFWLSREEQTVARNLLTNCILKTGNIFTLLRASFDKNYCARVYSQLIKNDFEMLRTTNSASLGQKFINNLRASKASFVSKVILVPKQDHWFVSPFDSKVSSTKNLDFACDLRAGNTNIKCKLYKRGKRQRERFLILNVSSGINCSSTEDQEPYLIEWINNISAIAILTVNFEFNELKYPISTQHLLDIYLWCISDAAENEIGFVPQKIVICGEDTGALLSSQLCLIVNDIRKQGRDIPLPSAIVCIEACFPFKLLMTPSLISSAFHLLLNPYNVLDVLSSLLPDPTSVEYASTVFSSITNETTFEQFWENIKEMFNFERKAVHWFQNKNVDFEFEFSKYANSATSDYLSLLDYPHFDNLRNVRLHLIVSENHPFLDSNIELAKKWKGKTTLDVLLETSHLFLDELTDSIKQAKQIAVQRIQESLFV